MVQQGIGKLVLKKKNRGQVLRLLKSLGPMSRIDIADALNLTRAAVTIIINEMIEQNILHEVGEAYPQSYEKIPKGRKKILIDINHNYKFVIGAVIEGDEISIGLCTLAGDVLDKLNTDVTATSTAAEIMEFVSKGISLMLTNSCLEAKRVLGIGIGIQPSVFELMGVSMGESGECDFSRVSKLLVNEYALPVVFDNSIKGIAYANLDFFRDKFYAATNAIMIQYGWNYYSVVIAADEALEGYNLASCNIDNIIVAPNGEPLEGYADGSVKAELSVEALCRRVRRIYSEKSTPILYKLTGGDVDAVTYNAVLDAYSLGDKGVEGEKKHSIQLLTVLLNNLLYAVNPEVIILHNFPTFEKDEAEYYRLLPRTIQPGDGKRIIRSGVEQKHAFLGGCSLALRRFFLAEGGYL